MTRALLWLGISAMTFGCGGSESPADSGNDTGGDGSVEASTDAGPDAADSAPEVDADGADPDGALQDADGPPVDAADADVAAPGLYELIWQLRPALGVVTAMALGDLDGDGLLDLAVAAKELNRVFILKGLGDGSFERRHDRFVSVDEPVDVSLGIFGPDGHLDLAVARSGSDEIALFPGKGDLGFGTATSVQAAAGLSELEVADVDCDGVADLLALCGGAGSLIQHVAGADQSLPTPGAVALSGIAEAGGLEVGLIDGDACMDAVVLDRSDGLVHVLTGATDTALVPTGATFGVGDNAGTILLADLTGDATSDLVVTRPDELSVVMYSGVGDGTFELADIVMVHLSVPGVLAAGLVDDDDLPDLIVGTCGTRCDGPGGTDVYLLTGADGGLAAATPLPLELGPGLDRQYLDLAFADLDGEGRDELVVLAQGREGVVEVYRRRP